MVAIKRWNNKKRKDRKKKGWASILLFFSFFFYHYLSLTLKFCYALYLKWVSPPSTDVTGLQIRRLLINFCIRLGKKVCMVSWDCDINHQKRISFDYFNSLLLTSSSLLLLSQFFNWWIFQCSNKPFQYTFTNKLMCVLEDLWNNQTNKTCLARVYLYIHCLITRSRVMV